jgi:transcriptional regulator with XRE-family HTH domain
MNTIHDVSAALRKALQESGKTQQALRESAGLSRQTMVNVLRGSEDFRLSTLLSVADRLGLALALVPKSSAAGLQPSSQAQAVESVVDRARQMLQRTNAKEGGGRK